MSAVQGPPCGARIFSRCEIKVRHDASLSSHVVAVVAREAISSVGVVLPAIRAETFEAIAERSGRIDATSATLAARTGFTTSAAHTGFTTSAAGSGGPAVFIATAKYSERSAQH